jgi:predicted short-subunit dehydrogenase-like oxidoreductase (DUF2520 family)
MRISIIGAGKLGGALAIALNKRNFSIDNLIARNFEIAEKIAELINPKPKILPADNFTEIASDVILITTQDSEIETVAARLADQLKTKPFIFHTSGSLSSAVLRRLKAIGCSTGSIHPLVSISDPLLGADRFANAYFCVEGDVEAIKIAEEIVGRLGGESFSVAAEYKILYHAAAVTACGHLVALIDAAVGMLTKCGLGENDAREVLLPLVKSTVSNLENQTPAEALTGTFARADVETLRRHLEILRANVAPETLEIYLSLGERSLPLAESQGANRENLEKIRGQILLAKKNLK